MSGYGFNGVMGYNNAGAYPNTTSFQSYDPSTQWMGGTAQGTVAATTQDQFVSSNGTTVETEPKQGHFLRNLLLGTGAVITTAAAIKTGKGLSSVKDLLKGSTWKTFGDDIVHVAKNLFKPKNWMNNADDVAKNADDIAKVVVPENTMYQSEGIDYLDEIYDNIGVS